ncbi:hypothetical protein DFA_06628 [Cavenderia fasciculata]|uniref:Uncharacterized protein n=1 Tax=Cavenderia fasciculata TaxID=261658 RepID=F4Q1U2_CACFS|nr:uncharacterized protein DFA_06628 [Cavenderia fasciculata]EGG17962.1 hypothetical protein DFA_06628 [Cavenderia fasciculata]|eukprot:XP_004356854.1 hypothetical protein DFA_06628 [Cavenderia fasciculata]
MFKYATTRLTTTAVLSVSSKIASSSSKSISFSTIKSGCSISSSSSTTTSPLLSSSSSSPLLSSSSSTNTSSISSSSGASRGLILNSNGIGKFLTGLNIFCFDDGS